MPAFTATAPGKVILFGEHAAVYHRPAIAVPVRQVQARATLSALPTGQPGLVMISAPDIHLQTALSDLPADHPLALAINGAMQAAGVSRIPAMRLQVTSTIPIASGLGSGSAVTAAIARAVGALVGRKLTDEQVSTVVYQVDQKHHGTPSGIDNTVIAYNQPIFFIREKPFEALNVRQPFTLVIANTGIASPTGSVVADVRRRRDQNPQIYERLFDEIAEITCQARQNIETGETNRLGEWMDHNHHLLQRLDVSSKELDRLVLTAKKAGATGAKLSGGGRGGNIIALTTPETVDAVVEALRAAGAVMVFSTQIGSS